MATSPRRWTDRELEIFVERMHEFLEEDKDWKKIVRSDLDSLLLQREQIKGARVLLYWISLVIGGLAGAWAFISHEFPQLFK